MDSRKRILQIDSDTYRALMIDFAHELNSTRLQKFARMRSGVASREDIATYIQDHVAATFSFKTFADKELALEWLKSGQT